MLKKDEAVVPLIVSKLLEIVLEDCHDNFTGPHYDLKYGLYHMCWL
jgi:hypothetical protein